MGFEVAPLTLDLASSIDRIAPGRDEQRYMVVLIRMRDADVNRSLLDERRHRQRHTARAKVLCDVEAQAVATRAKLRSRQQGPRTAAVGARRDTGEPRRHLGIELQQLDTHSGGR